MKKIYLLLFLQSLFFNLSFGQGGTWTWIGGTDSSNAIGVYGTQGVPSINNHPPGLYEPAEWKDKQGNFWIYGGWNPNYYSDLWKYNPITNEWTWVKGNGLTGQSPVYGTQGIPNPLNTPGTRGAAAATWVDTSGAFWLFGGDYVTDLWEYDINTNQWTWIKGDTNNSNGVHGILGVPSPTNTPGARLETCSAWTDSLNNLWLLGGYGFDDNGNNDLLNDLCRYNISNKEWTWMNGSAFIDFQTNYGSKGVTNPNNVPGARRTYTKWKDAQDNFWLMGGMDKNKTLFNDVWKYDLNINEWTWMSGSSVGDDGGIYNSNCVFDTINLPYSRMEQRSAVTDNCGKFWLFGGASDYFNNFLNDLWIFDPQQLEWNWISGTNALNQPGNYGTLGIQSSSNMPSSRWGAVAWWGNDNKFYMFGGEEGYWNCFSDVWAFNSDSNCVPVCGAAAVVLPVTNFQSSKTTLCAYDCINFTDLSTNATSWQWLFAGAIDSTSTTQNPQNICYSKAGIYNVTLIASNAAGSDTVTFSNYITVTPTPPTPVITQHQDHDTLYCSFDTSYYKYQWFYDSTLIPPPAGIDTFLVISKSGNYNVQVTNKNGCSIAGGINVVLGVENYVSDNVVYIYPNPVSKTVTVYGLQFTVGRIGIYNVLGQEASPPTSLTPDPSPKERGAATIDVSGLCSGIYFVRITNESGQWVGKFVKE